MTKKDCAEMIARDLKNAYARFSTSHKFFCHPSHIVYCLNDATVAELLECPISVTCYTRSGRKVGAIIDVAGSQYGNWSVDTYRLEVVCGYTGIADLDSDVANWINDWILNPACLTQRELKM